MCIDRSMYVYVSMYAYVCMCISRSVFVTMVCALVGSPPSAYEPNEMDQKKTTTEKKKTKKKKKRQGCDEVD